MNFFLAIILVVVCIFQCSFCPLVYAKGLKDILAPRLIISQDIIEIVFNVNNGLESIKQFGLEKAAFAELIEKPGMTLDEVVLRLGYGSRYALGGSFKKIGVSWIQLKKRALKQAVTALARKHPRMTLDEAASRLGYSSRYTLWASLKSIGVSWIQLKKNALKQAVIATLIEKPDMTLDEEALLLGYNSRQALWDALKNLGISLPQLKQNVFLSNLAEKSI